MCDGTSDVESDVGQKYAPLAAMLGKRIRQPFHSKILTTCMMGQGAEQLAAGELQKHIARVSLYPQSH
jgi:hypothetical protein